MRSVAEPSPSCGCVRVSTDFWRMSSDESLLRWPSCWLVSRLLSALCRPPRQEVVVNCIYGSGGMGQYCWCRGVDGRREGVSASFFFVDSWYSWERAFPLCRRCCCRRWMAEGAAARWAGPRPGMTCWREVAVCSHSVASVLFWLAWWGADLPCRILCSTRWRLYCCGEKPTWRQ